MNDNERKAKEFLDYVASNMDLIRNNLKKNITYNAEIFEDVINDTIIKIHNNILRNGTEIKDYKQYFFMASRFEWILQDNRYKKKRDAEIRDLFDNESFEIYEDKEDEEERYNKTIDSLSQIRNLITNEFSEDKAELFLYYMSGKAEKRKTSYQTIAEEYKMNVGEVTEIITSIKRFLNENEETINKIKKEYYG